MRAEALLFRTSQIADPYAPGRASVAGVPTRTWVEDCQLTCPAHSGYLTVKLCRYVRYLRAHGPSIGWHAVTARGYAEGCRRPMATTTRYSLREPSGLESGISDRWSEDTDRD